jgi:hypothetical protein
MAAVGLVDWCGICAKNVLVNAVEKELRLMNDEDHRGG